MGDGLLALVIGMAICAVSALLLLVAAKRCRTASPGSIWSSQGIATALSLGLVGLIVIGSAWTIKGTIQLASDPLTGVASGFVAVALVLAVTLRTVGAIIGMASVHQHDAGLEKV